MNGCQLEVEGSKTNLKLKNPHKSGTVGNRETEIRKGLKPLETYL
ncbi:hypothetical protein [Moorena sp. SIO3H5]|nr:hypothetical protein [Moorena sp. SIO3H5]